MINFSRVKTIALLAIVLISNLLFIELQAQKALEYYLPDITYSSDISTPKEILNYEIGEWHISHDQLVDYLEHICSESAKCTITEYARSHENRPLVYLTISSKDNLRNIDSLRLEHNKLSDPTNKEDINIAKLPLVLYQGYSIHGNESSGGNASALLCYYLLAGKSAKIDSLLNNTIILLDPCYNPDGFNRFSSWVNSHKAFTANPDPSSIELNEVWPGGRTNHYWFDLNRDWLFTIHPSSKGRIQIFHEWKPDILTDHHEMGSHSTFFFQPGVPSRTNPNTPQLNQDLTEEIGNYHASFLDSIGSQYFTKERYDDYYYGKGSTYPDINGCIGILFEQASSRGHIRETKNGLLDFPFTIRNQLVTSLSTQEAALELRTKILKYKREFYKNRYDKQSDNAFYIFKSQDNYISNFFIELLNRHDIDVYSIKKSMHLDEIEYPDDISFVVPKKQKQSSLIKTIFEKVNEFPDSIFYDVSAWTLPLALNLDYTEGEVILSNLLNKKIKNITNHKLNVKSDFSQCLAVAIDWGAYNSPALVNKLLEQGLKLKALSRPSEYVINGETKVLSTGTVIMTTIASDPERNNNIESLFKLAELYNIELFPIDSGYSKEGASLGSNNWISIKAVNAAMIIGDGINAYDSGYTWYQMDQRLEIPLSLIDQKNLRSSSLKKYNVLILPDGSYTLNSQKSSIIKDWVKSGGTLIAMRRSIEYARRQGWLEGIEEVNVENTDELKKISYSNYKSSSGSNAMGGTIINTTIDIHHPLFYGYLKQELPMMKQGTQFYVVPKESSTPMVYSENAVLSGYASEINRVKTAGAAGVICSAYGNGTIIACVDNPNFRGIWLGGSKLFANMLFMSDLIERSTLLR